MQSTDILAEAAVLIIGQDKTIAGPYGLFANAKHLVTKPLKTRVPGDMFIMRFSKEESESGLLCHQWDKLHKTLLGLVRGGKL